MDAVLLYESGQLAEAIAALAQAVRTDPLNAQKRTMLFELLCFAGDLDRAEKHLEVLAGHSKEASMGALLYHAALHADRARRAVFADGGTRPVSARPSPVRGTLNGRPFKRLTDADPRIGARLEIFAAGQYTWFPLEQIAAITMQAPRRLRDLLWSPAHVRAASGAGGIELGEVLLPAITPEAAAHEDDSVRLGRITDWLTLDDGVEVPVGAKLLDVDGEGFPILEVRELIITGSSGDEADHAAAH